MFDNACVFKRFAALVVATGLGCFGCAGAVSNDETMAELGRLRAAVRASDERMAAMQAHQEQLTQQLTLLSTFVGIMANETARKAEMARKKESLVAGPATSVSDPADPVKPAQQSNDLEF